MWLHWQAYDIILDIHQVASAASSTAKQTFNGGMSSSCIHVVLFIMTRLTLCSTDVVLSVTREQHGINEMFYKKRRRSGRSVMMWWKVACSHPMFLTTNNKLSNNPKSTDRHSRTARNIQKTTDERAYSRECNILGSNLAEGNTLWYYLRVYSNLARFNSNVGAVH